MSQYRRGWDISYCAMARRNQALVSAANYHFGSYRDAVIMAGIDYDRMRKKPQWTRQRIVTLIRRAHRNRQDLSWRAVIARGDELARAAMAAVHPQLFGRWNDALTAAGINPDRVARYHRWTRRRIIDELRARSQSGLPVNSGHMQIELPGLCGSAIRQFGSYDKALAAAGIDPTIVKQRRDWTRRRVVASLSAFYQRHGSLTHTVLRGNDSGLLRAAYKFFGNLESARKSVRRAEPTLWDLPDPLSRAAATTRPRRRPLRDTAYQATLFDDVTVIPEVPQARTLARSRPPARRRRRAVVAT